MNSNRPNNNSSPKETELEILYNILKYAEAASKCYKDIKHNYKDIKSNDGDNNEKNKPWMLMFKDGVEKKIKSRHNNDIDSFVSALRRLCVINSEDPEKVLPRSNLNVTIRYLERVFTAEIKMPDKILSQLNKHPNDHHFRRLIGLILNKVYNEVAEKKCMPQNHFRRDAGKVEEITNSFRSIGDNNLNNWCDMKFQHKEIVKGIEINSKNEKTIKAYNEFESVLSGTEKTVTNANSNVPQRPL